ncbi:MAG: sugar phosphate isomerase/epimerase [Verrucomicrobia bacterium]|nr:sugar phosphate isomerase/epimerase [Verrucomicrobiota bacterium]
MKIGMNMLLWTPFVDEEHFHIFETLKKTGYDGVEIPVFAPDAAHYQRVGRALKDHGLGATVVSIIPNPEQCPISDNPNHRRAGVAYLKEIVDCCAALDAEVLCGPLYQPLGVFSGDGPTEQEKVFAADVHHEVAEYAQKAGIDIAVEPLNRFECYFANTLDTMAEHARRVNHPALGIMYDTFHGNIEEKDPAASIGRHMELLKHIHISSNDRGTPGNGVISWSDIFRALRTGGYDRWLTIEAFGRSMPDLAATTKVWRDLSAGPEEVYTVGFNTIKNGWEAAA